MSINNIFAYFQTKEIAETDQILETLKTELHTQKALERDMEDNRDLKLLEQKQNEMSNKIADLARRLGDLDCNNVSKEKKKLIAKRDKAVITPNFIFRLVY